MHQVPCHLCGEKREFDEVYKDRSSPLCVVRCRGCGLVFANPTMTAQEHLNFYSETYWNDIPSGGGGYTSFPPERVAQWEARAKAHIDYLATFCGAVKEGKRIHVLEVGCGYAAHSEEILKRCPECQVAVVEPNRRLYNAIRQRLPKVQILGKTVETLGGGRMLFECILVVDVLERAVDPTAFLRRIQLMLHPQGVCLLITHNGASRSGVVYDLSHLTYFTEGTLARMLDKCHLRAERMDLRGETSPAGDERIYCIVRKK